MPAGPSVAAVTLSGSRPPAGMSSMSDILKILPSGIQATPSPAAPYRDLHEAVRFCVSTAIRGLDRLFGRGCPCDTAQAVLGGAPGRVFDSFETTRRLDHLPR